MSVAMPLCGHHVPHLDTRGETIHRCGWCGSQLCPACCWWRCFADEWRLIGAAASVRPEPQPGIEDMIARSSVGPGPREHPLACLARGEELPELAPMPTRKGGKR